MKILILFGFLLLSCCVLRLVNTQNVQFASIGFNGTKMVSSAITQEGFRVQLNCSFDAAERDQRSNINMKISTKVNAGDAWIGQVVCRYGSDSNISGILDNDASQTVFNKDNATCTINTLDITLRVKNLPKYFQCLWTADGIADKEVEIVLQPYSIPSRPKIDRSSQDTPTEGSRAEYTCESHARPPPMLGFVYEGQVIPISELTHIPSLSSITDDSSKSISTVIWTTKATKAMNGKNLLCRTFNHLSGFVTFEEHRMSVRSAETGGVGLEPNKDGKSAAGGLKPGLIAVVVTVEMLVMLIL